MCSPRTATNSSPASHISQIFEVIATTQSRPSRHTQSSVVAASLATTPQHGISAVSFRAMTSSSGDGDEPMTKAEIIALIVQVLAAGPKEGLPLPLVARELPDEVLETMEEGLKGFVQAESNTFRLARTVKSNLIHLQLLNTQSMGMAPPPPSPPPGALFPSKAPTTSSGATSPSSSTNPPKPVEHPPNPPAVKVSPRSPGGGPRTVQDTVGGTPDEPIYDPMQNRLFGQLVGYSFYKKTANAIKVERGTPVMTPKAGVFHPIQRLWPVKLILDVALERKCIRLGERMSLSAKMTRLNRSDVPSDQMSESDLAISFEAVITAAELHKSHPGCVLMYGVPKQWTTDALSGVPLNILTADEIVKLVDTKGAQAVLSTHDVLACAHPSYPYLAAGASRVSNTAATQEGVEEYDLLRVARFVAVEEFTPFPELIAAAREITSHDLLHVILSAPDLFVVNDFAAATGVKFKLDERYIPDERRNMTREEVQKRILEIAQILTTNEAGQHQLKTRLPMKKERRRLKQALAIYEHGLVSMLDYNVAAMALFDQLGPEPHTQDDLEMKLPKQLQEITFLANLKFLQAFPNLFRVYEIPPNLVVQCLDAFREDAAPENRVSPEMLLDLVKTSLCECAAYASKENRDPYETSIIARLPKFAKDRVKKEYGNLANFCKRYPSNFEIIEPTEKFHSDRMLRLK